jgi:hypothetical protein
MRILLRSLAAIYLVGIWVSCAHAQDPQRATKDNPGWNCWELKNSKVENNSRVVVALREKVWGTNWRPWHLYGYTSQKESTPFLDQKRTRPFVRLSVDLKKTVSQITFKLWNFVDQEEIKRPAMTFVIDLERDPTQNEELSKQLKELDPDKTEWRIAKFGFNNGWLHIKPTEFACGCTEAFDLDHLED